MSETVTRCDCCDLPVESCGKEAERAAAAEQKRLRAELLKNGYFEATYSGRCARCGEYIHTGDPIRSEDMMWVGGLCCGETDG